MHLYLYLYYGAHPRCCGFKPYLFATSRVITSNYVVLHQTVNNIYVICKNTHIHRPPRPKRKTVRHTYGIQSELELFLRSTTSHSFWDWPRGPNILTRSVVKVRGLGGSAPLLPFDPPCNSMSPLIESIKCYFMPK